MDRQVLGWLLAICVLISGIRAVRSDGCNLISGATCDNGIFCKTSYVAGMCLWTSMWPLPGQGCRCLGWKAAFAHLRQKKRAAQIEQANDME